MSEKLRRQKDIVKHNTESYLNAITDYQDYYDGASPISITYYQISDEASRTDTALEDVHEIVGASSSLNYFKIKHLPARGMAPSDISNQLTQRGLESFINGEFVLSPSAGIVPRSGEFFTFEDEITPEINQHLFVITDVQFDRATSQKFYKCEYKLYPLNADNIYSSVVKTFVYNPKGNGNSDGVGDSILITEAENELNEAIDNLTDSLIDKFEELFYDDGMDTFAYQKSLDQSGTNFSYYWSPYVCHFIYKNNILEKNQREFLTEIFVQDINEREFPNIYSEEGYRKSIFYAAESENPSGLNLESTFMEVSSYDLSKPLNLPFFTSAEKYYLLDTQHKYNTDFWLGCFNWLYDNEDMLYTNIDGFYRYSGSLEEHFNQAGCLDSDGNIKLECQDKILNKTFYELNDQTLDPFDVQSMIRIYHPTNTDIVKPYLCDLPNLIENTDEHSDLDLLSQIILEYFRTIKNNDLNINNEYIIKQSLLLSLNDYYYENTLRNYLLLPIIIYILKNNKGEEVDGKK